MSAIGKNERPLPRQRGVALFIVLVIVMLGALLAAWASRSALLNEMLTGNDSDYQRAFEAAQAMVRDAEFDILGMHPDGSLCQEGCRTWAPAQTAEAVFFPTDPNEYLDLKAILDAQTLSCIAGLCTPDKVDARFWEDETKLLAMQAVASHYGKHTGAKAIEAGNPLLIPDPTPRAWYWIELLPYSMSAAIDGGKTNELAPDAQTPFVYRITAIAHGRKPHTQAVVQTIMVRKKKSS